LGGKKGYDAAGPALQVHIICQIGAAIVLGVAAARGIPARLCFSPHHPEFNNGGHFWVELPDEGLVIDLPADRRFRVRAARRPSAAAA
jgi:hypothetical protein